VTVALHQTFVGTYLCILCLLTASSDAGIQSARQRRHNASRADPRHAAGMINPVSVAKAQNLAAKVARSEEPRGKHAAAAAQPSLVNAPGVDQRSASTGPGDGRGAVTARAQTVAPATRRRAGEVQAAQAAQATAAQSRTMPLPVRKGNAEVQAQQTQGAAVRTPGVAPATRKRADQMQGGQAQASTAHAAGATVAQRQVREGIKAHHVR
jgi:hypothetical protein